MEKVPHRVEPLLMSINLAQKTKDPKRMADAIEKLLALGWPGDDDVRGDARKTGRATGQDAPRGRSRGEADALLARLPEARRATSSSA